eukprot:251598-Rhodomonas_salina.1
MKTQFDMVRYPLSVDFREHAGNLLGTLGAMLTCCRLSGNGDLNFTVAFGHSINLLLHIARGPARGLHRRRAHDHLRCVFHVSHPMSTYVVFSTIVILTSSFLSKSPMFTSIDLNHPIFTHVVTSTLKSLCALPLPFFCTILDTQFDFPSTVPTHSPFGNFSRQSLDLSLETGVSCSSSCSTSSSLSSSRATCAFARYPTPRP